MSKTDSCSAWTVIIRKLGCVLGKRVIGLLFLNFNVWRLSKLLFRQVIRYVYQSGTVVTMKLGCVAGKGVIGFFMVEFEHLAAIELFI